MYDILEKLAAYGFVTILVGALGYFMALRPLYNWLRDQRRRTWFVGGLLITDVAMMLFGATVVFAWPILLAACKGATASTTTALPAAPDWQIVYLLTGLDVLMALCAIAVIPLVGWGYFAIEADRAVPPAPAAAAER